MVAWLGVGLGCCGLVLGLGLGLGLWGGGFGEGLAVDGLGEVGAHGDELVQDLAVVPGVLVALAGQVGRLEEGGGGGHRGA